MGTGIKIIFAPIVGAFLFIHFSFWVFKIMYKLWKT